MYEYLRGTLTASSPSKIVVDVHGIGFSAHIALNTFGRLPQLGQEILLYVAFIVREDAQILYGFLNPEERDLFLSFCGLSGIGPKTAIALLGHMDLSALQMAIYQENHALLCKIPGIGRKTAERLVIEMRGRLKPQEKMTSLHAPEDVRLQDAMNALLNLGYHPQASQKALTTALAQGKENLDLATLITTALKHF